MKILKLISAVGALATAAVCIGASSVAAPANAALRAVPTEVQEPSRPATAPAPTREQNARAQEKREENARAQQQQEKQRADNAREAPATDPKFRDAVGRLIAAERVHREQLARINRLKEIAQRKSESERVAELDKLLARSNDAFERKLQFAQAEMPEADFTNAVKMLERGRRRDVKQSMGQGADATKRAPPPGDEQPTRPKPPPEPPKQDAQRPH